MLGILFFCVLLAFTVFYIKGILSLVEINSKRESWIIQPLFSLLWILPELLCLGVCYIGRIPQLVIPSMMTSFFILMIGFAMCHLLNSFSIEKKANTIYLISIFLYMMIVLNLSFSGESTQMLFGIKVPSILFLFLYLVSLLFQNDSKKIEQIDLSMKGKWVSLFISMGLLTIILFKNTPTIISMTALIIVPKITIYYILSKYKINLFPNFFYDGMVRFYLIGIFDILFSNGMIYHLISHTTSKMTHGMIYVILLLYLYFIPKREISKLTSLLIIFGGLFLFIFVYI